MKKIHRQWCEQFLYNREEGEVALMITKQWQAIGKDPLAAFYVIVGQEGYLRDETVKRLKSKIDQDEWFTCDLEQQTISDVMLEADTLPFFSDKKGILVLNPSFLRAAVKDKEKEKESKQDIEAFVKWLENPPTSATIIFMAPYEKLDERKKVVKQLKKASVVIEATPLTENDQKSWIQSQFRIAEKQASTELIEWIAASPASLEFKRNEIQKVAVYVGAKEHVDLNDYDQVATPMLEDNVFALGEAYFLNQKEKAIKIYHELLKQKEEPLKLVALLASQLRLLLQVGYYKKQGYHSAQIATQIKAHPYRVKLMMDHPLIDQEKILLSKLKSLAEVDMELKSSGMKKERILELYLLAN